jgi:hypothetical protein
MKPIPVAAYSGVNIIFPSSSDSSGMELATRFVPAILVEYGWEIEQLGALFSIQASARRSREVL